MRDETPENGPDGACEPAREAANEEPSEPVQLPREIGGRKGPEPTRYGDWENDGRCIDF